VSVITSRASLRWLTVVALALALLALPTEANAVSSPGGLSPTGAISSSTPTLSWSRVSGAAKYEVQITEPDGAWSSSVSTVNNRYVPTKLLPGGAQEWRVRAIAAGGDASGWSTASIRVSRLGAPSPSTPRGGVVLPQPKEPPLLEWGAVPGATSYAVEITPVGDSEFTSAQVKRYRTQVASLVVPDPLMERYYHWRVKAQQSVTGSYSSYGQTIDSQWSDPASFEIDLLPAVDAVSPLDPSTKVQDVVLEWNAVPGAQYYQVRVATEADFTESTIVDQQAKVLGTSYSPAKTYDNNQYYWQVRPVDLNGQPTPWTSAERGSFTRAWPHTPQARYPLGTSEVPGSASDPLYFQWSPVKHATQYELQVGTDLNFSPDTFSTCQVAGTSYTSGMFTVNNTTGSSTIGTNEDCNASVGVVNYWRVKPLDLPFNRSANLLPGVQGLFSTPQAFIYRSKAFVPGGFSPANNEVVDVPTLRWQPARGVERYQVAVQDGTGRNVLSNKRTYATSYTPVGLTKPLDPAKNPYTWSVHAIEADGRPGSLIHTSTFNVSGADAPTSGVAPLTPLGADGSTTVRAPEMTWEPMPGATTYRVFAGPAGTGTLFPSISTDALEERLPYPAVTDTWTHFLQPGRYSWFVQAYDANGVMMGRGPTATFRIDQLAPVAGQRIALDGLSLDAGRACQGRVTDPCLDVPATPVFDWQPVEGASMYMLYVSEDADFTNVVEPLSKVAATVSTRWAPSLTQFRAALPDSEAGASYSWFVRPCKKVNICGPSPVSTSGMATNEFRKKSPAVVPTAPAEGARVTTNEVTLNWEDYRDTNAKATWAPTGEASTQSAMWYRVQVDDNANFSSPLETVEVDQSQFTSVAKLYPEGTLYWRVQAIDAEDNALTWSARRSFVKDTARVSLSKPVAGAAVHGTTPFRWAPQAFAASYEVEVATSADGNFSTGNRLFLKTGIKNAAFSWDQPIPVSSTPYAWRVRRKDPSGNYGPWSAVRFFTSTGTVPERSTPLDGAAVPSNAGFFTWKSVPGATSYKLEVRQDGSSYSWATVTTPATAWAPDKSLRDGRWTWRVQARDSNGNVIGQSGWGTFSVDASGPTVVKYAPASSAKRKANMKVVFSEPVVRKTVNGKSFQIRKSGARKKLRARVTVNATGTKAVLNPRRKLKRGQYYTVVVSSRIKDRNGNPLTTKTWSFRVR